MGDIIEEILDAVEYMVDLIDMMYDFITDVIDNTLLLFEYLGLAKDMSIDFIATMPVWLQSFAIITVVVSVIYMILGRSSGGKKE